jgi:diadenosine tetraphosphate (Ap4A) HIT family hydrolase
MDPIEKTPIYETTSWKMVLNPKQEYLGRAVVLLKRECGDLADVTEEEMLDFLALVRTTEAVYRKTLGTTMFNWSCAMNNAYQEKPPKPHVHWHLVPRYETPAQFGGASYPDRHFGRRSENNDVRLTTETFTELARALTEAFQAVA